jgi:hypothetical protein
MPKIDIDKVAIDTATGYPPPFNKAVEGRSRKRLARAAGLTHFGVNVCTLKPARPPRNVTGTRRKMSSSTCSRARSSERRRRRDRAQAGRCGGVEGRC